MFCKDCNIEISSSSHFRTHKHKENCLEDIEPAVKLVRAAFRNRIVTYQLFNDSHPTDVKLFLQGLKDKVINLLRNSLRNFSVLKVNLELYGRYLLPSTKEYDIKSFNSRYGTVTQHTNLEAFFNEYLQTLLKKSSEFTESGSSWALSKLLFLELNINKQRVVGV
jgi:hypothetical protein